MPIEGAVTDFECHYIFAAIGQDTDLSALDGEPKDRLPARNKWSTLETESSTTATNVKGVFAGGDVVLGPSAVIDAIAHGRSAALAIDGYLSTGEINRPAPDFRSSRDFFGQIPESVFEGVEQSPRARMPEREASERVNDFVQVELGLDEPQIRAEASRCMECGCKSVFGCDLKRYAAEYDVDIARVAGEVRRHTVDRSHPLISLDPNKCILCGRCIRTCADIVGLSVLGFVGRGFATTVRPAMGRSMAESSCIACGACIESCPTGALEARLQYGRQGPWKTHKVPSVCTFCSVGCDLDLNVVADGLMWATAPEVSSLGRGELCKKGRFGTGLMQGADRLRKPLIRKHGKLVEAGWDEAIEAAAGVLQVMAKATGPETVGVFAAPRMTLEEALLARSVADALGTTQAGSFGQTRRGGPRHDLDEILGDTASTCTMKDLDKAELIVVAGADPGETHPVLGMAIRRALNRGAEMVAINSSRIDLLRSQDLWLDARRGTAGTIYAAVISQLLQNAPDRPELEVLKASVAPLSLDGAALVSGVDAGKLQSFAEKMAAGRKTVVVYDLDETLERSTDDLKGLAQLMAVAGHLGEPGEGLLLLRADCNSLGAKLAGLDRAIDVEKIRGVLVMFENPYGDYRAQRLLTGLEALVVVDHFLTETARMADVVLPAATLAESEGTVISFDGRVVGVRPGSTPAAGLSNSEVLGRLAAALGRTAPSLDPAALRTALGSAVGIDASALEQARSTQGVLPSAIHEPRPAALQIDSTASIANFFPYATLDGILEKKLQEMS